MLAQDSVKGWSIICVDDEEIVLNSLRRQLRKITQGYRIEVATTGIQALKIIEYLTSKSRPVALVITDQVMPIMNGDDLLIRVKDVSPDTYQVMLTGQADGESVGRVVNDGKLFRFMSKPWSENDLRFTVKTALEAFHRDLALQEKTQRLQRAHQRSLAFIPHDYLRALGKTHFEDVERGDAVSRKVAIMFSDIRGFTTLIEQMSPQASFHFVNQYYQATESSIYEQHGFVDHYFGDGVMAIFPEGSVNGLKASIEFLKKVDLFNQSLREQGQQAIQVGIGLHIGEVIMGVCGGNQSIQCTVIGDCVNLTARLEGLSGRYQTALVISHDIHKEAQLQLVYQVRELDYIRVKGRSTPTKIYEVLDVLSNEQRKLRMDTLHTFSQALEAMRSKQIIQAIEYFDKIIALNPLDQVAILHLSTCKALLKDETLIDNQGVYTLREK